MKLKELKHNHSLTDLLKILIFSVLMITPLLSVATRCLYVICNKNAYQSAEITQTTYNATPKYTQGDVNNDLEVDKIYHFTINNLNTSDIVRDDDFLSFIIINGNFTSILYDTYYIDDSNILDEDNKIIYSIDETGLGFDVYNAKLQTHCFYEDVTFSLDCDLYLIDYNLTHGQDRIYFSNTTYQDYTYSEVESTTLDNVFEYSVNKLQDSQVINWTSNTGVYTGVSAMTSQLGIEGAVIPMLITYWFLLTIIYVIIDIILKLFTILTHMIGNKQA